MDFSAVKPNGSGDAAPQPSGRFGPSGGGTSRIGWIIGGAVLLAVIVIITAVSCGGGGSSSDGPSEDAIKTAHGPDALIDGVPRGYTHDSSGARTAAVNFIQAIGEARMGRLDSAALSQHAVSSDPSQSLESVIDLGNDRDEREGEAINTVPLIATVTDFDQNEATVAVWAEAISQSPAGDDEGAPMTVSSSYSTTEVTLAWEDGDWKASDWSFEIGPDPKDARFVDDGPLSELGGQGFYTFYRD